MHSTLLRGLPLLVAAMLATALGSCINQGIDPAYEINDDLTLDGARPLPKGVRDRLEGLYLVEGSGVKFGDTVVMKWGGGYLSMYCGNTSYAYATGGYLDSAIQMVGYWRNAVTLAGGRMGLRIDGVFLRALYDSTAPIPPRLAMQGNFSDSVSSPSRGFVLRYLRPLPKPTRPFHILGHRAGGRNSDYHPVSENTPGMCRFSERLGANGVEIDVRLSRDGVPIIFHDENISTRLVQQGSLIGPVANYSFEQLRTFARLVRGELIPTLREMLDTVLEATSHRFVYLDVKSPAVIPLLPAIQDEYLQKARARGRDLTIVIGLPDEEVMSAFLSVPDYLSRPSLNELTIDQARRTNAHVWAPRWTQGVLAAEVAAMHAEGRLAVVWTLDDPRFIRKYMAEGDYDGILTNYPAMVAWEYYMHGVK